MVRGEGKAYSLMALLAVKYSPSATVKPKYNHASALKNTKREGPDRVSASLSTEGSAAGLDTGYASRNR
jgi:hypothetical protein